MQLEIECAPLYDCKYCEYAYRLHMYDFFWVPSAVFAICMLAIFALRPLAIAGGLIDRPDSRKRHVGDVPLVGGIAIALAVCAGMLLFMRAQGHYVALLGGVAVLTAVGIVDDLRGIPPIAKLVAQLFAAILMTSWGGVYLTSLGDLFGRREIELVNWGIPLTLFAVVAVINAMNMSDGLDGLAGGLAIIIFLWFAYLAEVVQNFTAQRISVIFMGAILAFLVFNMRNPARGRMRIFLGDAGSLMLGFAIVWFAVELSQPQFNGAQHVPPVVMLWVFGFILIDLLTVVLRRVVNGRNPLAADRSHLHHVLLRLRVHPDVTVWIILVSNAVLGLAGVVGWRMGLSEQALFLSFLLVTFIHLFSMRHAWRLVRLARRWRLK